MRAGKAASAAEAARREGRKIHHRHRGTPQRYSGSDLVGLTAVWQSVLESLRSAWADFCARTCRNSFCAFAARATVWQGFFRGGSRVWEQPLARRSLMVVQRALALLDTRSGRPCGHAQAVGRLRPADVTALRRMAERRRHRFGAGARCCSSVLVQLFDLLGALWTAHLQPLGNELAVLRGMAGINAVC